MHLLDRIDARILLALDDDPQSTVVALARRLSLARNTVQSRLARLQAGALHRTTRRVDPATLGYPVLAFVTLEISQGDIDQTVEALRAIPEVLEVHATTGDGDVLCRVVARGTDDLHRITRGMLSSPSVMRTRTSVALREYVPHRTAPLLARLAGDQGPELAAAPAMVPDVQARASR